MLSHGNPRAVLDNREMTANGVARQVAVGKFPWLHEKIPPRMNRRTYFPITIFSSPHHVMLSDPESTCST